MFLYSITSLNTILGCTGRRLQSIIDCNFASDNCGFRQSGFNWSRSADVGEEERKRCKETEGDLKQMKKNSQFMKEIISKEPHFIYSITKPCVNRKFIYIYIYLTIPKFRVTLIFAQKRCAKI